MKRIKYSTIFVGLIYCLGLQGMDQEQNQRFLRELNNDNILRRNNNFIQENKFPS